MEEKLEIGIGKILKRHDLELFSIKRKREFGEWILEIRVKSHDLDADTLAKIHEEIILEYDDLIDPNIFLELSTMGAEYPITTKEDLVLEIGNYIHLVSPNYHGAGTLISFSNEIIELQINDKGRFRKIQINYRDASKLRRAVKF